jgi:transposase
MFHFEADLKVFLHREPIDFRAGINSLVTLVEQSMQLDPFARAVYAFHNRRRNRIKLLLYERNGFWLMLTAPRRGSLRLAAPATGGNRADDRAATLAAGGHRRRCNAPSPGAAVPSRQLATGSAGETHG